MAWALTVGEDALRERRVEAHLGKPPGWLQTLSPEERTTMIALVEKTRKEAR